jgi:predicted nuclease with TOPRIM domain
MIGRFLSSFLTYPEDYYDDLYYRIEEVNALVLSLRDRIKRLEEENIELTNELYRLENSLDSRIDILAENPWGNQFE